MPMGIGVEAAKRAARLTASEVPSPAQLFPFVQPLAKGAELLPPSPALPGVPAPSAGGDSLVRKSDATTASARLWQFRHDGATPHTFTDITARVRDTGYRTHTVLDEIKLGRLEGDSVTPQVRIVTEA